jgi:hypothetical protein
MNDPIAGCLRFSEIEHAAMVAGRRVTYSGDSGIRLRRFLECGYVSNSEQTRQDRCSYSKDLL